MKRPCCQRQTADERRGTAERGELAVTQKLGLRVAHREPGKEPRDEAHHDGDPRSLLDEHPRRLAGIEVERAPEPGAAVCDSNQQGEQHRHRAGRNNEADGRGTGQRRQKRKVCSKHRYRERRTKRAARHHGERAPRHHPAGEGEGAQRLKLRQPDEPVEGGKEQQRNGEERRVEFEVCARVGGGQTEAGQPRHQPREWQPDEHRPTETARRGADGMRRAHAAHGAVGAPGAFAGAAAGASGTLASGFT